MRELLRSNDLVHLSWAQAILAAEASRAAARRPRQRRRRQHRRDPAPADGARSAISRAAQRLLERPAALAGDRRRSPRTACSAAGCVAPAGAGLSRRDRSGAAGGRGARGRGRDACSMPAPAAALRPCAWPRACRAAGSSGSSCSPRCSAWRAHNVALNELGARVEMHRGRPRPAAAAPRGRELRPRDDQPAASRRGEAPPRRRWPMRATRACRAGARPRRPGSRAACACCGRAAC